MGSYLSRDSALPSRVAARPLFDRQLRTGIHLGHGQMAYFAGLWTSQFDASGRTQSGRAAFCLPHDVAWRQGPVLADAKCPLTAGYGFGFILKRGHSSYSSSARLSLLIPAPAVGSAQSRRALATRPYNPVFKDLGVLNGLPFRRAGRSAELVFSCSDGLVFRQTDQLAFADIILALSKSLPEGATP